MKTIIITMGTTLCMSVLCFSQSAEKDKVVNKNGQEFWSTKGNEVNREAWLGTKNKQALILKANNIESVIITETGDVKTKRNLTVESNLDIDKNLKVNSLSNDNASENRMLFVSPNGTIGTGNPNPLNAPACNGPFVGRFNTSYNHFEYCSSYATISNEQAPKYGAFALGISGAVNFKDKLFVGVDGRNYLPGTVSQTTVSFWVKGDAEFSDHVRFSDNIRIYGSLKTDALYVDNTRVKIGDQEPTWGNHTNYKLSVDGKIVSKESVVTSLNWADFVFEEDYKLNSLKEVEEFIKENHHLPGVPSEKEVLKNGVNLGEMDAILLQKIEELTLYVIKLSKENEELRKIISE